MAIGRHAAIRQRTVEAVAECIVADPHDLEPLLVAATATDWREPLGLPRPSRLFGHAIDALREELPDPPTIEALLVAAARLRDSLNPAAVITGMLLDIALEQRLIAEVAARRLESSVLDLLIARRSGAVDTV